MKNLFIFLLSLFLIPCSFAQAPDIEWENLFCDGEYEVSFVLTPDGGAVVITSTFAPICNEKNETGNGGLDYWIYKIDASGALVWQSVLGGSGDDRPYSINLTADGGYIVAGTSNSPISGDKTEPNHNFLGPYYTDMWILKLDATGNIIWQNTIGGNNNESIPYIEQISTGEYILSCTSYSPLSGDKMEGTIGGTGASDYWILKLNSTGNIIWQNTIGGNETETIRSVHQTTDGGFICTGSSSSGISGDKTKPLIGATDYWIIKLNNSGNIKWQKTIGSLNFDYAVDIIVEPDGTYTLGGYSDGFYTPYFEIIKLNSTGTVLSDKTIETGEDSKMRSISKTLDGGYIIGGTTNISGPPCNSYGWECWNLWVIKTNSLGIMQWNKALGSGDDDGQAFVKETAEGEYLVTGFAGIDEEGDISDKESLYPGTWIVKLNDSICTPSIELCNSFDDNCNGIIDEDITESITVSAGGPTTFCSGGSVLLSATTYTGPSLQWKKNGEDISGATSSTYFATATGIYTCETSSACAFAISEWVEVTVNKNPNASISAGGPTTFCAGSSVILTEVAVAGCTYQWYKGASPIAGATSLTYNATTSGNYKCRVTKTATGCYKNSNAIAVSVPCREGEMIGNEISVYPNPASNNISIITKSNELKTIEIFDAIGNKIIIISTEEIKVELNIEKYAPGVYFILIQENGVVNSTKIIKL
ncbi:MAG: T9SS type A sorting domain-containing protein [Bacteroidetes bacterium]|nr:T9SS type A sorting domain-containing protein [Bacteroidota bacterium]